MSVCGSAGFLCSFPLSDGYCSQTSTSVHSVAFGEDARFTCYLPLTASELQTLCSAGADAVLPYFGNLSTSFAVWGSSNFTYVNEWITISLPTATDGVRRDENTRAQEAVHAVKCLIDSVAVSSF